MAQPANFSTIGVGADPTVYYAVSASLTPETPAPPFQVGQEILANNGAEFVFVQASTSIALGDFVAITNTNTANSLSDTNVDSSLGSRLGMACTPVRGSVTLIPAGAFFWAQIRGNNCTTTAFQVSPAGTLQAAPVALYTSATAGTISSTSGTAHTGIQGVLVVTSASTAINAVYQLTWPRTATIYGSAGAQTGAIGNA